MSVPSFEEFRRSLDENSPPEDDLLRALWYDAHGDWEEAHRIVQDIHSHDAAWIHAYLHRKEGDLGNARYWYRRANRGESTAELEEEWEEIARALLAR